MSLAALCRIVLATALVAAAANAAAGSLQVSPMRIDLAATRPTMVLRVVNPAANPITVQAEARAWSYEGERDIFEGTEDVLLNPPIFTIAPGATQFVRIGLRARAAPATEASYRLFLEELPGAAVTEGVAIQTLLRLSLPIFVAPAGGAGKPDLKWRFARDGPGAVTLSATNAGRAHIHLQGLTLHPPGADAVQAKISSYLLPGQSRQWRIAGAGLANAPRLELTARSDAGDLSERLVPAP